MEQALSRASATHSATADQAAHRYELRLRQPETIAGFRGILSDAIVAPDSSGRFSSVDLLGLARDGSDSALELLRFSLAGRVEEPGPGCYGAGVASFVPRKAVDAGAASLRPSGIVYMSPYRCWAVADGSDEVSLLAREDLSLQMRLKLPHRVTALSFDHARPSALHARLWAASPEGRVSCLQRLREDGRWLVTAHARLSLVDGAVSSLHAVFVGQSSALLPNALFPQTSTSASASSADYSFTPSKGLKTALNDVIADLVELADPTSDESSSTFHDCDVLSRMISLSSDRGTLLGYNCPLDVSVVNTSATTRSGGGHGAADGGGAPSLLGDVKEGLASAVSNLRATRGGQLAESYLSPVVSSSWGSWLLQSAASAATTVVTAASAVAEQRAALKQQQQAIADLNRGAAANTSAAAAVVVATPMFGGTVLSSSSSSSNPSSVAASYSSATVDASPAAGPIPSTAVPIIDLSAPKSVARRERDYVFRDPGKFLRAPVVPSADGKLLLATDASGRVLLFDAVDLLVLRVFKGHRDAQVAWIKASEEGGAASFVIFSPKRGLLEAWRPHDEHPIARKKLPRAATSVEGAQLIQARGMGSEEGTDLLQASTVVLLALPGYTHTNTNANSDGGNGGDDAATPLLRGDEDGSSGNAATSRSTTASEGSHAGHDEKPSLRPPLASPEAEDYGAAALLVFELVPAAAPTAHDVTR